MSAVSGLIRHTFVVVALVRRLMIIPLLLYLLFLLICLHCTYYLTLDYFHDKLLRIIQTNKRTQTHTYIHTNIYIECVFTYI